MQACLPSVIPFPATLKRRGRSYTGSATGVKLPLSWCRAPRCNEELGLLHSSVTNAAAISDSAEEIARDVSAVNKIAAVPTLLDVLCETTGMRFATVARVSETT